MDLFLETPQQKADRILRQQQRLFEMGARASASAGDESAGARAPEPGPSPCPAAGSLFDATDASSKPAGDLPKDYSLEQESYRRELDYDRARHRNRRWAGRLRVLAMAILVPLGLVLIFLASYGLTCILNGASPDEVVQHLTALGSRLSEALSQIRASWGI